ncbi:uncharacterized protein LOC117173061 isoform X2 [Belonocnema kinseyi]|uniref:uncharacterized protein LOC117173061 isoform X2 n=1 Tax=Belonocnema kinseyi TaxID=2817044 RepID=UPI00143DCD05|nr:uncharacterized protein LOC117173061 isoform X2 [Belonocnema kinseyi]
MENRRRKLFQIDRSKSATMLLQKDLIKNSSEEDKSDEDLDENEASEKEDEDNGSAEDEYEDELKAVAESHEAMSHDDTKKCNTSFFDGKSSDEKLITAKNFDSREKSVEETSDENESSNEADIDDDILKEKKDKEVAELLEKKRKRLPTVKKELRTQKEIQSANETLEEEMLTENVLNLLVKLAEDPKRWERVHQLLMDIEGGLEHSRQALQTRKRNLLPSSFLYPSSTAPTVNDPLRTFKKPKKKKKKKKPHQKVTTSLPMTTPLIETTDSPWLTTPVPWRLVAEKLFRNPWREESREENPKNMAKVRYSMMSKPRTPPPGHQLIDEKQRETLKALNNQREALMLKSAREYSQPRLLHFGKVNTHQIPLGHREVPSVFDDDPMRNRDYDPPELLHYQSSRFPQYNPFPKDFPLERFQNDYQDDFALQSGEFARNREYRPKGRDFAASKTWQDSQFDYERPWNLDDRTLPITPSKWSWRQPARQPDLKTWLPWRKPWKGDYWSRLESEDDEEGPLEKSWQMHQKHHQQPWKLGAGTSWPGDKSLQVPTWPEKLSQNRHQDQILSWDKGKNRSELKLDSLKQDSKEKGVVPKITMKSWNSLTSDPATWPFRLPAAKPWPKDQNGKSYNPNADLVRKLGLDKQNRLLPEKNPSKDFKPSETKYKERTLMKDSKLKVGKDSVWPVKVSGVDDWMSKAPSSENLSADDDTRSWTENMNPGGKTWPGVGKNVSPKIQSMGGWEPVNKSTWRPYELKHMESYDQEPRNRPWPGRSNNERMWNSKSDGGSWPQKMTDDWNEGFGKQTGTSSNWPSKWKQFAYHRVTAMPLTKSGTSLEGSVKPKNAFIAVSAVSSPKYNNEWRKNDIEETPISQNSFRSVDPDHPASQLRSSKESPIYAWKKDGKSSNKTRSVEIMPSDPLEDQLEDLRLNLSLQNDIKNENPVNGSESTPPSLNLSNVSFVGNLTKESSSLESKATLGK